MFRYYILNGHEAVGTNDVLDWGERLEQNKAKIVAKTFVGKILISTAFLGIDHSFGSGPPLLFETMVFGGKLDDETVRYTTWEEAEEGHKKMVEKVKIEEEK